MFKAFFNKLKAKGNISTSNQVKSEIATLFPAGHFYSPIVDPLDILAREKTIWSSSDVVMGVNLNIESQLSLLKKIQLPPE